MGREIESRFQYSEICLPMSTNYLQKKTLFKVCASIYITFQKKNIFLQNAFKQMERWQLRGKFRKFPETAQVSPIR
jgi:hypothetical protein